MLFSVLWNFWEITKLAIRFVMYVRPSVSPHMKTRLLVDGFSRNYVLPTFYKNCPESFSLFKTRQSIGPYIWNPNLIFNNISLYYSWNGNSFRKRLRRIWKDTLHVQRLVSWNLSAYEILTSHTTQPDRLWMIEHNMAQRRFDLHAC